jgi:hypothetical protein
MDIPVVELNFFNKKMKVLVDFLFVSSDLLIFFIKKLFLKFFAFSSALVKKVSVFCEVYLLAIRYFST